MSFRKWKPVLAVGVLVLTGAAFVYYFIAHPEVRQELQSISPGLLVLLVGLYLVMVAVIGLTFLATMVLCNLKLPLREGLLVTMYSSVINFFGPLQSGPAFRAVYLKQRHGLKVKQYTLATLLYYAFFAGFSGLFLLSGILGRWLLVGLVLAVVAWLWLMYSSMDLAKRLRTLNLRGLGYLAAATGLQVCLVAVIYMIELHAVNPSISFSQVIVYTGAANFALFVSITPGAIGFREAFLVFSQHLHHISNVDIVTANIIDRTVYIVMLLVLALIIFGTHAQARLKIRPTSDSSDRT